MPTKEKEVSLARCQSQANIGEILLKYQGKSSLRQYRSKKIPIRHHPKYRGSLDQKMANMSVTTEKMSMKALDNSQISARIHTLAALKFSHEEIATLLLFGYELHE